MSKELVLKELLDTSSTTISGDLSDFWGVFSAPLPYLASVPLLPVREEVGVDMYDPVSLPPPVPLPKESMSPLVSGLGLTNSSRRLKC